VVCSVLWFRRCGGCALHAFKWLNTRAREVGSVIMPRGRVVHWNNGRVRCGLWCCSLFMLVSFASSVLWVGWACIIGFALMCPGYCSLVRTLSASYFVLLGCECRIVSRAFVPHRSMQLVKYCVGLVRMVGWVGR